MLLGHEGSSDGVFYVGATMGEIWGGGNIKQSSMHRLSLEVAIIICCNFKIELLQEHKVNFYWVSELMDPREYFRELYIHELQRRDNFPQRLSIPIGLLGLFGGAAFKLTDSVTYEFDGLELWILLMLFFVFLCLAWAGVQVYFATVKSTYSYPDHASVQKDHLEALKKFKTGNQADADELFLGDICERWIQCADTNGKLNDKRSEHLFKANRALLLSLVPMVIAGIFAIVTRFVES